MTKLSDNMTVQQEMEIERRASSVLSQLGWDYPIGSEKIRDIRIAIVDALKTDRATRPASVSREAIWREACEACAETSANWHRGLCKTVTEYQTIRDTPCPPPATVKPVSPFVDCTCWTAEYLGETTTWWRDYHGTQRPLIPEAVTCEVCGHARTPKPGQGEAR